MEGVHFNWVSTFLIFYLIEDGTLFMDTCRMAFSNNRYYFYERVKLN